MGLANLLYRCPQCGAEPVGGEKDEVHCPGCGSGFTRGRGGLRIVETMADGSVRSVPAYEFTAQIRSLGGPLGRATQSDGSIRDRAKVRYRRSLSEEPVYFRGRLLGFSEQRSEEAPGELSVTDQTISLETSGATESWEFLDLLALQTSSSSVQISTRGGGVIQFKFPSDSSRRWEDLLRILIGRAWREAGRGEILEFQPRILTHESPGGSAP